MLNAEGYTDDGHKAEHRGPQMTQGKPETGNNKPDDISDHPKGAGSDIVVSRHHASVHDLFAEGKEAEVSDNKAGLAPRNADNRNVHDDSHKPPAQAHEDAAEQKPDDIPQKFHYTLFPLIA